MADPKTGATFPRLGAERAKGECELAQIKENNEVKTKPRASELKDHLYNVVLHNDDVTTYDFVIELLMEVFYKGLDEALALTIQVDKQGSGVAGQYSLEIARTKRDMAIERARAAGFPLRVTVELDGNERDEG